jgi:hypothetical protein
MSGRCEIFYELDIGTMGAVKLGDGTEGQIEGKGTIIFECRNGKHLALTQVYYIPRLRSNILSLGQMDELRCDTHIRHCLLRLCDADDRMLACVKRNNGRLYVLHLTSAWPMCLLASGTDPT